MKKLSAILVLSLILLSQTLFVLVAQAVEIEPPTKYRTIEELVEAIIRWVFNIGVILFPLMILWGAFTFMTAAGRPDKIETGKKIIFWSIVGLALILFSKVIISIVRSILTG